jgi:hypothetical protein
LNHQEELGPNGILKRWVELPAVECRTCIFGIPSNTRQHFVPTTRDPTTRNPGASAILTDTKPAAVRVPRRATAASFFAFRWLLFTLTYAWMIAGVARMALQLTTAMVHAGCDHPSLDV